MNDKDITIYALTFTVGSAGLGLEGNALLRTPFKSGTLEAVKFISPDDYHQRDQNRDPLRNPRFEVGTTVSSTSNFTFASGMQIGDSIFTWPRGSSTSS